ncbi:hypothetical protein A2U01_0115062, partial [Trifolium medium]|nr:hypothetical protein [Trifolium medium]
PVSATDSRAPCIAANHLKIPKVHLVGDIDIAFGLVGEDGGVN